MLSHAATETAKITTTTTHINKTHAHSHFTSTTMYINDVLNALMDMLLRSIHLPHATNNQRTTLIKLQHTKMCNINNSLRHECEYNVINNNLLLAPKTNIAHNNNNDNFTNNFMRATKYLCQLTSCTSTLALVLTQSIAA